MTNDARLAPLEAADLSDRQLALLEPVGGVAAPHLFRTLVRNDRLFRHALPLAGALMAGRLDPRQRELVILRVAYRCQCRYEWAHHVHFGRTVGLSDDEIARVAHDPTSTTWNDVERALLAAVDESLDDRGIGDNTWQVLARELEPPLLIELLTLIGNYTSGAMTMNSLRIEVDAPDAPALGSTGARGAGG